MEKMEKMAKMVRMDSVVQKENRVTLVLKDQLV
jgi:hypothetical protein